MSIANTQLADEIANKIDATFAECVKLPLVGPDITQRRIMGSPAPT